MSENSNDSDTDNCEITKEIHHVKYHGPEAPKEEPASPSNNGSDTTESNISGKTFTKVLKSLKLVFIYALAINNNI